MTDELRARRLRTELEQVPLVPQRVDWDTPEGEAFLRHVITMRDEDGDDVDDIGAMLGIPNLRHVVGAREKYLRGW